MENASRVTSFVLAAYGEMGYLQYLYFFILLVFFLIIICANVTLIVVICVDISLHKPMYIFLCSLSINQLYGSTALCPSLLVHILSNSHDISRGVCLLQIFCLHTYGGCELSNLAVMGYDRYVSICHPLHYNSIMSPSRVYKLTAFIWLFPICTFGVNFILTIGLPLCGSIIEKVYCDNFSVVKLSCINTNIVNIAGLIMLIFNLGLPCVLIFYSYAKILRICLKPSKESQTKALRTCVPHLVTIINYMTACLFELIQNRFNMSHVPYTVRIIISLYFLLFTPLLNPIIYGVKMQSIRNKLKKMICARKLAPELEISSVCQT